MLYCNCGYVLFYWVNVSLSGAWCTPRNGGPWYLSVATRCSQLAVTGPIQGAIGVVADLVIILLPVPVIY